MNQKADLIRNWIKLGVICGLLVSVIYPSLIFVPMPALMQVLLAMAFGPLLGISSVGLYHFITLHKATISAAVAVIANVIAGVLITSMLLVQMAIRSSKPEVIPNSVDWVWKSINKIHMGLDVAWDVYIFLGTFLFAISVFSHPKLGRTFSVIGLTISISLIALNAISFPDPPAGSGLVDVGPLVGLWYLAVTISIIRNYKWVETRLGEY